MQLLAEKLLPDGLWVLKWIDRLFFDHGSQSAHVELHFEKLVFDDVQVIDAMTEEDVQACLARRGDTSASFETIRIQAAYLPKLFVGAVFRGTKAVSRLNTKTREIRVRDPLSLRVRDTTLSSPTGWTAPKYRALNPFEYGLPHPDNGSRCLVFEWQGTQYVMPKVVVFRTFYGMHTRLIDALFGSRWPSGASAVISFAKFESGIETALDPETGAWKIVLEQNIPDSMAAPLAFYWFDEYARQILGDMYTDHIAQNSHIMGAAGRSWQVNADIPHPLRAEGFAMSVDGFPLRRFRRHEPRSPERFLVTEINRYEWTPGTQVIQASRANSNKIGEIHTVDEDATRSAYSGFSAPVTGLHDALAASAVQGSACDPENRFHSEGAELWPKPKVIDQLKTSSTTSPHAPPLPSDGPSPVVSAASKTHRETPAAPAALLQHVRAASEQYKFLIAALDELRETNRIRAFEVLEPPTARREVRDGLPCWSLDTGSGLSFAFIKNTKTKNELPSARARAALVLKVALEAADLLLVEIEVSTSSSSFRMFAWPASDNLEREVHAVLGRVLVKKGIFTSRDCNDTISARITGIRHQYEYDGIDELLEGDIDDAGAPPRSERARGLRPGPLYAGLLRCATTSSARSPLAEHELD